MSWFADLQATWAESRRTKRYMRELDALDAEIASMSLAQARASAVRVLAAPRFVKATKWSSRPKLHADLGPVLREFFTDIQVVEIPESEQCADVALLEPFDFVDGFLNLGSDGEHTHLAIKPGDDAIYIVADDTEEDHVSDTYASVYHWIVYIERREGLLAEYRGALG
jgi:hypothetical protein